MLSDKMYYDSHKALYSLFLMTALVIFSGHSIADIGRISGEIAGEVTADSVILQSRLTLGTRQENGEVQGSKGWARFVVSADESFSNPLYSEWIEAKASSDYIIKAVIADLQPHTRYFYRLEYGSDRHNTTFGDVNYFKTLAGAELAVPVHFVHATCMTYQGFHYGDTKAWHTRLLLKIIGNHGQGPYKGEDKHLGYPGLEQVSALDPEFVIFNGDNLYYDHGPKETWATDVTGMRYRWHRQFSQPRFLELFTKTATYWTKDDHDFRFNDGDLVPGKKPTVDEGINIFQEQVPVVNPNDQNPKTYRTHRVSKDLQMWYLEGRDYRSPNEIPDGPNKTMWGAEQKAWIKETLLASDASFKIIVSPTPLIGPDRNTKNDNHVNPDGYRYEGQEFLDWLKENNFENKGLYLLVGDRHWQYHSIDPRGIEEFSSGSFSFVNAQKPTEPGGLISSDPEGLIKQPYVSPNAMGGFIDVNLKPSVGGNTAELNIRFMDEYGAEMYQVTRVAPEVK